jgi:exoribonuclease R
VRQLKFETDRTPALALLGKLLWKQTPQGAFDLLVQLGAWRFHEDLALLRSGFPLRFTAEEETAAKEASKCNHDPDSLLGIRWDFRQMKVFTIDGPSTTDIDDGLSIEKVMRKNTEGADEEKYRIWIHIADADRWAPRDSALFEVARQRITSLYLPTGPITMFPESVTEGLMSLQAYTDSYALSLGVELNDDGSVDKNSLVITPSIIQVTYRLTYDDVDEMLEEGIGYQEEWELGALLGESLKRRKYRIARGSTEGIVLNPIPYATLSTTEREGAIDGIDIELNVQVAYNSGKNQSSTLEQLTAPTSSMEEPVSSSYLLVTEAMIMAGEAIGHWKAEMDDQMAKESSTGHKNSLRLAFRTQPQPGQ